VYLTLPLTLPFVDADRKGGNAPNGAGITARWWFLIALVLAGILWQMVRAVVKG
jgi:hypothetical protein